MKTLSVILFFVSFLIFSVYILFSITFQELSGGYSFGIFAFSVATFFTGVINFYNEKQSKKKRKTKQKEMTPRQKEMTPRQKAIYLVNKFYPYVNDINFEKFYIFGSKNRQFRNSKDVSASIVDEIINVLIKQRKENDSTDFISSELKYWGEVLKEIDSI